MPAYYFASHALGKLGHTYTLPHVVIPLARIPNQVRYHPSTHTVPFLSARNIINRVEQAKCDASHHAPVSGTLARMMLSFA